MKNLVNLAIISSAVGVAAGTSCAVADSAKVDCGYAGITQSGCESKGCCWAPAGSNSATPWCYHSVETSAGYSLSGVTETATGFTAALQLIGSGSATYGADIKTLKLEVTFETADIAHVKITDASATRWEIPQSVIPRRLATTKPAKLNYRFTYTENPFTFEVVRVSDGRSVFKMDGALVFKDQYLELSASSDPTAKTFGLGESTRLNHALQTGKTYTMWAADIAAAAFDRNLYSSHPFYLQLVGGQAHGAVLLNSNGMDVTLQPSSLTFKAIGGVLDLYVFSGGAPADVVAQYTSVIGRPALMPYWALGFHNCKYGYTSLYEVEDVVSKYASAQIPLDTQWMDIDYMQNYRDFTWDAHAFPQNEVAAFVDKLHANGQHFVPIVDPGIMVFSGYEAYERGVREGLFLRDLSGGFYLGQVWPGPTYFPDFLHPQIVSYWTDQLADFHSHVAVDGIWIDMNEASNFCNVDGMGQVCANSAASGCPAPGASQTECCLQCRTVDATNKLDFPPYAIGNAQGNGKLGTKTLAASARHYNNETTYNTHNLYGLTEQIATNAALTTIRQKRPFLLSRSSFPSTGAHSAKWTGDNAATWDDLKSSVISLMDFSLFGVPMIGADICGFLGDTTEELCARWIELGAFYPFSRNHNAIGQKPQELYLWPSVTAAAKKALAMRYQLLPFLYTQFFHANTEGAMVARPLWANFPQDANASTIQAQFMLGGSVLVSPVLDQGATSLWPYFPQGTWYRFGLWQPDSVVDADSAFDQVGHGGWRHVTAALTDINVHVKGGSVLPLQQAALTTTAARKTPFTLVAALCEGGKAFGDLFWDDGEQVQVTSYLTAAYQAETSAAGGVFTATITHNNYASADEVLVQEVAVVGLGLQAAAKASVNGVALPAGQVVFDAQRHSLRFTGLKLKLSDSFKLEWN